jgi:hypothetical protein
MESNRRRPWLLRLPHAREVGVRFPLVQWLLRNVMQSSRRYSELMHLLHS